MEQYLASGDRPRPGVSLTSLILESVESRGIANVLEVIRQHLEMDVAFISRFEHEKRTFEHVAGSQRDVKEGGELALDEGYCRLVTTGQLPELMPDTSLVPRALQISATHSIPIGAHLGVPILLKNGATYGTLCCYSHEPNPELDERAHVLLQTFARVLAIRIDENAEASHRKRADWQDVDGVLRRGGIFAAYQPILDLRTMSTAGVEALARFNPARRADEFFRLARSCGLGLDAETAAIRAALAGFGALPGHLHMAVNSSPDCLREGDLLRLCEGFDPRRIVVELTEHDIVENYDQLEAALHPLRAAGIKVAVDDAGAGFASMRHILQIRPDIIKLDMSIVRDIDSDKAKRALAKALINFAAELDIAVVAEGVEAREELAVLLELGVGFAQGYYFNRPMPVTELRALFER